MAAQTTAGLLKEGMRHHQGLDDVTMKNIDACKKLSTMTRTSLGPNGMNKMVINHQEKILVTNDAVTVMKELEVVHPAAKMVVMAAQMQEAEVGDGTNWILIFVGELLQKAEGLLRMGVSTSAVMTGYTMGGKKALELLEATEFVECPDIANPKEVQKFIKSAIASKQFGYESILSPLVAEACCHVLPKNPNNFLVDNVRVSKVVGGGPSDSVVIRGLIVAHDTEGSVRHLKDAKIAVFQAGFDLDSGETKTTVLIKNAEELKNWSKEEEAKIEQAVEEIAAAGVNCVVAGGNFGDMALHFLERKKIMALKIQSKFELRRLCKSVNATPLVRLGAPLPEEQGRCNSIDVEEYGDRQVTVLRGETDSAGGIATILLRAGTKNILDDIERCIDDAVNVYRNMCRDNRFVPGGGAVEMELGKSLSTHADSVPGMEQYALKKYAECFEAFPRTLAENTGLDATQIVSDLIASHVNGSNDGLIAEESKIGDTKAAGIFDLMATKLMAIKLATDCAVTILSVDQIVMSKPAGGPRLPGRQGGLDGQAEFGH